MSEQEPTPVVLALKGLLKVIGAVAGAVVGVGTLAFSAGFLAQRAQYDFAQVPFVFIDYWAYAEAGLMALAQSINLFVSHPLCLALMGGISVVIVLALESDKFRRAVLRPQWTFVGYLVLIAWLGLVLRQQMEVRRLRDGPVVEHVTEADGTPGIRTTTVPARFPFVFAIPEGLDAPSPNKIRFPNSSVQAWERIADDLERQLQAGAVYLEVRPKPSWAVVMPDGDGDLDEGAVPVLGVAVEPEQLDSERAKELYRVVLSAFLFGVWLFLLLGAWQKRIYRRITGDDPEGTRETASGSPWRSALYRLREELWFSSRWILRSIAALLLVATGIFLMPECHGLLAMPTLGQEYVEVILEREAAGDGELTEPGALVDYDAETHRAIVLLNQYTSSDRPEAEIETWRQQVADLDANGSTDAIRVLKVMADASSAISTELSDMAQEAISLSAFAVPEGFMLYYPRSETDYLRILRPNSDSAAERWTIYPVRIDEISEIRVKRDGRTDRLVRLLRRMSDIDTQNRQNPEDRRLTLFEIEKLGHPLSLEVAIGGTYDRSHLVRGFGIQDIGRYAAGLPLDGDGRLRRQIAAERLIEVLRDREQRTDHRAVAATALHRFVPVGDGPVCRALVEVLESDTEEVGDDGWPIRGSVITTVGKLRCRAALPILLARLEDPEVPVYVRGTIPTQLIQVGTQENSAQRLGRLLSDPETPADVVGPALTALSLLEGKSFDVAVDAVVDFLNAASYSEELVGADLVSEYRAVAVDSLRQLGSGRSVATRGHVKRCVNGIRRRPPRRR